MPLVEEEGVSIFASLSVAEFRLSSRILELLGVSVLRPEEELESLTSDVPRGFSLDLVLGV